MVLGLYSSASHSSNRSEEKLLLVGRGYASVAIVIPVCYAVVYIVGIIAKKPIGVKVLEI